jgi:hypothetical protein
MAVPFTRRAYLQMSLDTTYVLPLLLSIRVPTEHPYVFRSELGDTYPNVSLA